MNRNKYKVGKVSDFSKNKGWFFGNFADNELLQSDLVEVAWQNISNKTSLKEDKHIHTSSVEINIVISGEIKITIGGRHHTLHKGEFYIIWPETIVENVEASNNTELIVVRAPSINDKVQLN